MLFFWFVFTPSTCTFQFFGSFGLIPSWNQGKSVSTTSRADITKELLIAIEIAGNCLPYIASFFASNFKLENALGGHFSHQQYVFFFRPAHHNSDKR